MVLRKTQKSYADTTCTVTTSYSPLSASSNWRHEDSNKWYKCFWI